jgi:nucleoside-diphosphate-sugar epimerase
MSVLVTGATGFVARAVVRRLLAKRRHVIALARGRGGRGARERVLEAFRPPPACTELDVVEGDLESRDCGLGSATWRILRSTVETVVNCAGDPRFEPEAPAAFVEGHVYGPRRLLEGLAGGRLVHWAQVSTAFVCGRRSGTILERDGDVGQEFNNTYERVKLMAEHVLREAGAGAGVDVRVFRPSIVIGAAPPTAGGTPSSLLQAFIWLLAALARASAGAPVQLRVIAAPAAPFNIVPVDYVATAIVVLAERAEGAGQTFHLVVREAPTQDAVLESIMRRLGVRGVCLVDPRRERLDELSPLEAAIARRLRPYRAYLAQDLRFDDATASELLGRCGVEAPTLSIDAIYQLVDDALAGDATGAALRLASIA